METRWDHGLWLVAVLCVLMCAPLACRRSEPPATTATAPAATSQEASPAPDQSLAEREQAVAEREAKVAERETALARHQATPPSPASKPGQPQIVATTAPQPAPAPTEAPPATPRPPLEVVVPAGTALNIEFGSPIASNTVGAGSTFATTLANDVWVNGLLAIAAGTEIRGTVVEAVPAKKIGGQARLALSFDHLHLATGETIPIAATFADAAKSQTGKDAATIGGAAAGGAILGRVLNKKNKTTGTLIGAVVGGAIGTAIAAKTPGEEVTIPAGSIIEIRLTEPVTVPR